MLAPSHIAERDRSTRRDRSTDRSGTASRPGSAVRPYAESRPDSPRPPWPPHHPPVRPGLWSELLLHRPCGEDEDEQPPEPLELSVPASPRRAVRALRASVAAVAARMSPRDRRAIGEALADQGEGTDDGRPGDVQALAALHRGRPVGFAFTAQNGEHLEWSVRPVLFLVLVHEGASCGSGDGAPGRVATLEPSRARPPGQPQRLAPPLGPSRLPTAPGQTPAVA